MSTFLPHDLAASADPAHAVLLKILTMARWAPSNENEQRWRFEIQDPQHVVVHFVTDHLDDAYAFAGRPLLMSIGCLLETLAIAASRHRQRLAWQFHPHPQHFGRLELTFTPDGTVALDDLFPYVIQRVSDRRRYALTPLTAQHKQQLQAAVGEYLELRWFESVRERWQMGQLGSLANYITMTIPEGYPVHQRIIDWDNPMSPERLPVHSLGGARASVWAFRWIMGSAARHRWLLARPPGATWSARLELNVLPALCSAAHFMLVLKERTNPSDEVQTLIRTGQALQRLWLRATQLGLAMSPNYASVVMAHHGRHHTAFTRSASGRRVAQRLATQLDSVAQSHGTTGESVMFMGRLGVPPQAALASRATRLPLEALLWRG